MPKALSTIEERLKHEKYAKHVYTYIVKRTMDIVPPRRTCTNDGASHVRLVAPVQLHTPHYTTSRYNACFYFFTFNMGV